MPRQVKKWRLKKPKRVNVDPALLSFDRPVSGSLGMPEDMAEMLSREFELDVASLNNRGFLRFQKGYDAPPNAIEKFLSLARSMTPELAKMPETDLIEYKLSDRLKFDLLCRAHKEFQHAVPNSMLYYITSIRDACKFYSTSVSTNTPYDDLPKVKDFPKNLHIQKEPIRFDPETDTMFGGISAFPQSSTIVSGLRAKKKYKSISAPRAYIGIK